MAVMTKEKFIDKFLEDQYTYRMGNGFYNTTRAPNGKVIFTESQLFNIYVRFQRGDTMTDIAKDYKCSRQTIRENLKRMEG